MIYVMVIFLLRIYLNMMKYSVLDRYNSDVV